MRPDDPVKLVRKRLDAAGVEAHLQSLTTAEHVELRVKGGAGHYSDPAVSLDDVARRLAVGEIAAVQIRFFDGGQWWCDTVLQVRDDYRLVRIREGA